MNQTMAKTIFIGGSARSGTTLLGEMLGSQPGVFNAGELSLLWRDLDRGNACGCGQAIAECRIWAPAVSDARQAHDLTAADLGRLARARARLASSAQVPTLRRLARTPESQWATEIRELVAVTRTLQARLLEHNGATVLVDTSKMLPSLLFTRLLAPDLHLIHLYRDPRGVAASFSRSDGVARGNAQSLPPGARPSKAVGRWARTNALLLAGGRVAPTRSVVSYEDLVGQPPETLGRLCTEAAIVFDPNTVTAEGFLPRETALHAAVGNPGRGGSGHRKLAADDRWRVELAPRTARGIAVATWPIRKALASR